MVKLRKRKKIVKPYTEEYGSCKGRLFIGIDNGVSGSIGLVFENGYCDFVLTPVFKELNYQKKVKYLNRINVKELRFYLNKHIEGCSSCIALLERPMVNPGRFDATVSALRALEATLIVLEDLKIPMQYVDSKEWQKAMLPKGVKGSSELKKASLDIGKRLFPQFKDIYKTDADGILIAEWAKRTNF